MSQIACEISPTTDAENQLSLAWRTPTFALIYGAAIIAATSALWLLGWGFVGQMCVPTLAAAIAIGSYLLTMSRLQFLGTAVCLFVSHAVVGLIASLFLWRQNPAMANNSFLTAGLFCLAVASVSAALAYWNRRRYWRLERFAGEEPASPKRISIPMNLFDYIYLATVVAILILIGGVFVLGVMIVGALSVWIRYGLAPASRGLSPALLIVTGLVCVLTACLVMWTFYPAQSFIFIALIGSPSILWSGVTLALRGDGYRLVRDFSAIADKGPIAEPDPLA